MSLPAHGDDVDLAVAVQVRTSKVLDGDAAVVEDRACPFGAISVGGLIKANAAAVAGIRVQVVADADNQLLVAVAIEVGAPDGVAPFEGVVEKMTVPELAGFARQRVGDNFVTVPRFHGCNVLVSAP